MGADGGDGFGDGGDEFGDVAVDSGVFGDGFHRAAGFVAEDDEERGPEVVDAVFDGADLVGAGDVAGDADDEEITHALVEEGLDGDTGIGAGEKDREGGLAFGLFRAAGGVLTRVGGGAADVALVAFGEGGRGLLRSERGGCGGRRCAENCAEREGGEGGETWATEHGMMGWSCSYRRVGVFGLDKIS